MPFTFSVAEYADMVYVYGFCDDNSVHAVAEYQQRFPNRRIPTRRVFTRVYQTLRDTGTLHGVRIAAERDVNEGVDEREGIVQMVQSSPRASTRRNARRLRVLHTRVWRTLHAEGMYPYHVQRVQHLGPGDFAQRLKFYEWLNVLNLYFCVYWLIWFQLLPLLCISMPSIYHFAKFFLNNEPFNTLGD